MRTKVFLLVAIFIATYLTSCNKEDSINIYQEDLLSEADQSQTDSDTYADLEESVQAIIRSLDISMKGLPANVNEITISPAGTINSNGEVRVCVATGTFTSAMLVKADDLALSENLVTSTVIGNGTLGFTTLTIPAYNASSSMTPRVVGFFYWGSTNQWELFHYEIQYPNGSGVIIDPEPDPNPLPYNNYLLESGRYLAYRDALSEGMTGNVYMNWTTAWGISAGYLNTKWTYNMSERYNATGCNAYYERSDKKDYGKWVLPTHVELHEIKSKWIQNQPIIGEPFNLGGGIVHFYWATDENTSSTALDVDMSNRIFSSYVSKTSNNHVRCVLDPKDL